MSTLFEKSENLKKCWGKNAIPLVFPIKEISLRPELSSPSPFWIQGGWSDRDTQKDKRTEILVSNIGWSPADVWIFSAGQIQREVTNTTENGETFRQIWIFECRKVEMENIISIPWKWSNHVNNKWRPCKYHLTPHKRNKKKDFLLNLWITLLRFMFSTSYENFCLIQDIIRAQDFVINVWTAQENQNFQYLLGQILSFGLIPSL